MKDKFFSLLNTALEPANRLKSLAITTVLAFGSTAGVVNYVKSDKEEVGYVRQNTIHPDEFFNTTPRVNERERIIIIVRGDEVVKRTQKLNAKGDVIDESEEIISQGKVKRGNEILRTGEELQDGDILNETMTADHNNNLYKESEIIQDGKVVKTRQPVDENGNSVELIKTGELEGQQIIEENPKVIDEKTFVERKMVTKDGSVIDKVFDKNGNEVPNGTILSDETILDPDKNKLKRIVKMVKDGKIITKEYYLRETEEGDQATYKEGLFFFKKNDKKGLSSKDEIAISRLQQERGSKSKSSFQIVYSKKELTAIQQQKELDNKKYDISSQDKDYSDHQEPKTTPTYPVNLTRVLTMDRIIPATIINEVNSEIPAEIVRAQIEEDIYAAHGRKILIPKGSKAIGKFAKAEDKNARRLFISWYRIITPSGINIKIEGEINDAAGSSGVGGEVDQRMMDRYGMALLVSTMNAMAQFSVPLNNQRYVALSNSYAAQFSTVAGQLIQEGLNIVPIIKIPQGARINIAVLQDIWFKEPDHNQIFIKPYQPNQTKS